MGDRRRNDDLDRMFAQGNDLDRMLRPEDDDLDRMFSADARLAAFADDLRTAYPAEAPIAEEAHVAAMVATADRMLAEPDAGPAPEEPGRWKPRRWKPARVDTKRRPVWVRSLVPALAATMLFAGAAVADVLPTPLQDAADEVGRWIGLREESQPTNPGGQPGASVPAQDRETEGPPPDEGDRPSNRDDDPATNYGGSRDSDEGEGPRSHEDDDSGSGSSDSGSSNSGSSGSGSSGAGSSGSGGSGSGGSGSGSSGSGSSGSGSSGSGSSGSGSGGSGSGHSGSDDSGSGSSGSGHG